jgi:hypothetical protein
VERRACQPARGGVAGGEVCWQKTSCVTRDPKPRGCRPSVATSGSAGFAASHCDRCDWLALYVGAHPDSLVRGLGRRFGVFPASACARIVSEVSVQLGSLSCHEGRQSHLFPSNAADPARACGHSGSGTMRGSDLHRRRERSSAREGIVRQSVSESLPCSWRARVRAWRAKDRCHPCGERWCDRSSARGHLWLVRWQHGIALHPSCGSATPLARGDAQAQCER